MLQSFIYIFYCYVLCCVQKHKQLHPFGRDSDVEQYTDVSDDDPTYAPDTDSDCSVSESSEMSTVVGNKIVPKLTKNVVTPENDLLATICNKPKKALQLCKKKNQRDVEEQTFSLLGSSHQPNKSHHVRRLKKKCPVKKCGSKVISLPRHLRLVHGWSRSKSKQAIYNYSLRKPYVFTNKEMGGKAEDHHHHRRCPVEGCFAVVKRLPPHIRKHHGIKSEPKVKELLANARRYCRLDNGISSSSEYTGDTEDQADDVDQEQLDRSVSADEEDTRVDVLDDLDSAEITESDPGRHLSFDDFEHWLKLPDGGLKPVKSAKQHKQQVMVIGGAVGKNCDCLDIINTKLIRERFLDHYVKEQKFLPGTTRSYLTSVVHFCNYVLDHEAVAEEDKVRVSTAAQCIRRWITAFRKECNQRVLEKMDDDISKLIKPEDVSTFENSELSKEAVKFLGAVASGEIYTISSLQYINVRDYLLARIFFVSTN